MKLWPLIVLAATSALAGSDTNPVWLPYVSTDSTAVIGIEWGNLRESALAPAIEAEIFGSGALAFPELECLKQAREIVVSFPGTLAVAEGTFAPTTVETQAQSHGLRRSEYHGVTLWVPEHDGGRGVAQIDDRLVLVGSRKDLETSINGAKTAGSDHFTSTGDLWIFATKPSGALANLFGLTNADASDFRAQAMVREGIEVEASFDAGPEKTTGDFAGGFREKPALTMDGSQVKIALHASADELVTAWHAARAAAAESSDPVKFEITHLENAKPQIVRIYYLDDGIHELALPPVPPSDEALAQPDLPPIVKIFNLDGGPRGILLPALP